MRPEDDGLGRERRIRSAEDCGDVSAHERPFFPARPKGDRHSGERARRAGSGRAEERRADPGRNAHEEQPFNVEAVVLEPPERPLVGFVFGQDLRRPVVPRDGEDGSGAEAPREIAPGRVPLVVLPGPALDESRRPPGVALGEPAEEDDDLPLHVEAPVVVARGRRLADAVPGEDDGRREGLRRDLRDQAVRARGENPPVVDVAAPPFDLERARSSRDLAQGNALEIRLRERRNAGERELGGGVFGRGVEAPRAEAPPFEGRRSEEADVRRERRCLDRRQGGRDRRRQRLDGRDADEVGGRRRTGRGRRRRERKTKNSWKVKTAAPVSPAPRPKRRSSRRARLERRRTCLSSPLTSIESFSSFLFLLLRKFFLPKSSAARASPRRPSRRSPAPAARR